MNSVVTLFNALTDWLAGRMILFLAACLLLIISILSPFLFMEILKEIVKKMESYGKSN